MQPDSPVSRASAAKPRRIDLRAAIMVSSIWTVHPGHWAGAPSSLPRTVTDDGGGNRVHKPLIEICAIIGPESGLSIAANLFLLTGHPSEEVTAMISFQLWLAFAAAATVVILIPGPT